jgi:cold shock CspA family protein
MLYGVVKAVNFDRGYGFISRERGRDVYVHATVVESGAFDRIRREQPVMYELERKDPEAPPEQGPRAKVVRLIDKLPGGLLPPPPQALAPRHHPKSRQRKPKWRKKATDEK